MDPSKPGKGILASLEHKTSDAPQRATLPSAAPSTGRGSALAVAGGTVVAALLAWWLYGGPAPVIMQQPPPSGAQVAHRAPPPPEAAPVAGNGAAAIVDETPAPPDHVAAPAVVAVAAPAPAPTAVPKRERMAPRRLQPAPGPKRIAVAREPVRHASHAAPDTDVVLLSALVAHAGARDIVEPRGSDSTDNLLQRCRRIGGEEGRLCRMRICTGRAGDGACHGD